MDAKEYLNAVADHIEKWGWIQGAFYLDTIDGAAWTQSPCCLLGGMDAVRSLEWVSQVTRDEAQLKLRRELKTISLAAWNDAPGRTKEEVIAVLRQAAGNG
jgi:hypothetical protein